MGLHLFQRNSLESDPLFVYCSAVSISDKGLQEKAAKKCTDTNLKREARQIWHAIPEAERLRLVRENCGLRNRSTRTDNGHMQRGYQLTYRYQSNYVSLVGDPPRTTLPKPFALIHDIGPRSLTSEASCHGCQLAVVFCLSLRSAMLRLSPKIVLHEDAAAVRRLSS